MAIFFTKHAKLRIKQRSIFKEQVEETIYAPESSLPSFQKRELLRKTFAEKILEVVIIREKSDIIVLTAYWLKEI